MTHPCPLCQNHIEVDLSYPCPVCGRQLAIKTNRARGTKFIGCTGYNTPEQCKWALSIPRYLIMTADWEAVRAPIRRETGGLKRPMKARKITIASEPELNEETLTPS